MKKLIVLHIFLLFAIISNAQPSFTARIENEQIVSDTVYEFDVFLYSVNSTFQLTGQQYYFNLSTVFRNSATISASLISGTTDPAMVATGQTPYLVQFLVPQNTIGITALPPASKSSGVVIPLKGLKIGRFRISATSGSFDISKPADLRWRWSTPTSALFYYNGSNSVAFVNNSNFNTQPNCYNPIYWNGINWSGFVFNGASNGSGHPITSPSNDLDGTILGSYTSSGQLHIRSLNIQKGDTFNMGTNLLNLRGNFYNYGGKLMFENATLVLTGNLPSNENQIVQSGPFTVNNLIFYGTGTKTLLDEVSVINSVQNAGGSSNLQTNGKLVLKSSAGLTAGSHITARIDELTNNVSINGNVIVEQYIPASKRAYRFLANPFKSPLAASQLRDDIFITGPGSGTTNIGATNSNNFDYTVSGNPSVFSYNPLNGNSSSGVDPGWGSISNGDNSTLPVGSAWRVLVRGDRSTTGVLDGTAPGGNAVTFDFSGEVNDGTSPTVNLSKSATSSFNLIGNPLNSNIDLNLIGGINNIDNGVWVWDQSGGTRGIYTTGSISSGFIIPAHGGFFVRVKDVVSTGTNVATITFPESSKTASSESYNAFKKGGEQVLINVFSDDKTIRWDRLQVLLDENGINDLDNLDIDKLQNPDVNLFSLTKNGRGLAIDSRNSSSQIIPLAFNTPGSKLFTFDFSGSILPSNCDIFFKDGDKLIAIDPDTKVEVYVEGSSSTYFDRFSIVINKSVTSLSENFANRFALFPNPTNSSSKEIFISNNSLLLNESQITYSITDLTGRELSVGQLDFSQSNILPINHELLPVGAYIINLIGEGVSSNLKFVKN